MCSLCTLWGEEAFEDRKCGVGARGCLGVDAELAVTVTLHRRCPLSFSPETLPGGSITVVWRKADHVPTGACTRHAGHTQTGGRPVGWRIDVHCSFNFWGVLEILHDEIAGEAGSAPRACDSVVRSRQPRPTSRP